MVLKINVFYLNIKYPIKQEGFTKNSNQNVNIQINMKFEKYYYRVRSWKIIPGKWFEKD